MKIIRFEYKGAVSAGIIEDDLVYSFELDEKFTLTPTDFSGLKNPFAIKKYGEGLRLKDVKILTPVMPSKVIAIGLNYKAHAAEFGKDLPEEPMLILKPPTAIIANGDDIILPDESVTHRVDFEGELAIVVSKKCRHITIDEAEDHILGYTCFNDVTARDLQKKDVQYTRAKGFDTFAPFGPVIETELKDPTNVKIETYLNGELKQESSTSDMVFDVYEIISFVSSVMTLYPGDIIATGTPSGVSKMKSGDEVEVRIEGIGSLINNVIQPA